MTHVQTFLNAMKKTSSQSGEAVTPLGKRVRSQLLV
jgi:hypothetical protein